MRKPEISNEELRRRLESEKQRFAELDRQKQALWEANMDIQEYQQVKRLWADSVEEIRSIHAKLYPYFPKLGICFYCGCDVILMAGAGLLNGRCIACDAVNMPRC